MKINWNLVNYDMLLQGEFQIPVCPDDFRVQAENIIRLVSGMEPFDYTKMSQFDMHIIVDYWQAYDGLAKTLLEPANFRDWFIKSATNPELIRRARQWLIQHNYLIPPQGVGERAQASGTRWGRTIKAR